MFFSGQDFIISGRSASSIKRNVIRPLKSILTTKGLRYNHNRSEGWMDFGGNRHYIFGANTEAAQDVLAGATCAGALCDEVARQPISFINEVIARLSVKGSKFWFNCNPKGPHHPFKLDYIDKAVEKKILLLNFLLDDNLSLDDTIKDKYKRQFTGVFYKRNILGLWVAAEGAVYDFLDKEIHCVKGPPPRFKNYILGLDFGMSHPTAGSLIGWNRDDAVFQVSEYNYSKGVNAVGKPVGKIVKEIGKWLANCGITGYINTYIDPSAAVLKAELEEWNRDLSNSVKFRIMPTNNSQEEGIGFVSKSFASGRFRIYDTCPVSWRQHCGLTWDPKEQQKGVDKVIKLDDDQPDSVRYPLFSNFGKQKDYAIDLRL